MVTTGSCVQFFCASGEAAAAGKKAANIQMSTIRPLSISVNEVNETVTVDAAVLTIDLLKYLANYVTENAPLGWTLPAFPWFVYQSIGGAVATGTHGSSLKYGSLSNQVSHPSPHVMRCYTDRRTAHGAPRIVASAMTLHTSLHPCCS
jgi:hypothetical protein